MPCSVAGPPPGPTRKSRRLQMPSPEGSHAFFPRMTARYSLTSLRHTLSGVNRPHLYTGFNSVVSQTHWDRGTSTAVSGRDRVFMAGHLTCIIQNFLQSRSWKGCCLQGPLLRAWGDLHQDCDAGCAETLCIHGYE